MLLLLLCCTAKWPNSLYACDDVPASNAGGAINSCPDATNSRCSATCWPRSIYCVAHGAREDLPVAAATRPEGCRVD